MYVTSQVLLWGGRPFRLVHSRGCSGYWQPPSPSLARHPMSHPRADVAQAQEVAEPASDGGCLATLLLSMRILEIFIISMGTKLYPEPFYTPSRSAVARPRPCQMVTESFRSLTTVEVSNYLCHFFDFSSCEGELASNIELVTGMRGWG